MNDKMLISDAIIYKCILTIYVFAVSISNGMKILLLFFYIRCILVYIKVPKHNDFQVSQ